MTAGFLVMWRIGGSSVLGAVLSLIKFPLRGRYTFSVLGIELLVVMRLLGFTVNLIACSTVTVDSSRELHPPPLPLL